MNIDIEMLPGRTNFLPHRMLLDTGPLTFENAAQAKAHSMVAALFDLQDVDKIVVGEDYVSLFHTEEKESEPLVDAARTVLSEHLPPLEEQQNGDALLPLLAIDAAFLVYLGL